MTTAELQAALREQTSAHCEQSRRQAEALAEQCARTGHDVPPPSARALWWKGEPVRCRRCSAVVA